MLKSRISLSLLVFAYGLCSSLATRPPNYSSDSDSVIAEDVIRSFVRCNVNKKWHYLPQFNVDFGFNFDDNDCLYAMAFDVGQANCVILRKGQQVVIVDAGGTFADAKTRAKAAHLLDGCTISAVFISHPHNDHFSLLEDQMFKEKITKETHFFLGGTEQDWDDCLSVINLISDNTFTVSLHDILNNGSIASYSGQELISQINEIIINAIKENFNEVILPDEYVTYMTDFRTFTNSLANTKVTYCGNLENFNGTPAISCKFLPNVEFEILNGGIPSTENNKNQKSFLLKVSYDNKSILFTGDSEGESVDRHIVFKNNIAQYVSLLSVAHTFSDDIDFSKIVNRIQAKPTFKNFGSLYTTIGYDRIPDYTLSEEFNAANEYTEIIRSIIKESQLIFLPHHGSSKHESQRWLGFFSNDGVQHCFVISSSPFGKDALPKRSNLEMAPIIPEHALHPFIYAQNTNHVTSMVMTTKPIYVTCAEPGGVSCFKIIPGEDSIQKFDAFRREDDQLFRWFHIFN